MTAPSPAGIAVHSLSGVPSVTITNPKAFGTGDKLASAIMDAFTTQLPGTVHDQAKK